MKKISKILITSLLLLLLVWPLYYFMTKKKAKEPTYTLYKPVKKDIKNFIVCSGIVLPKKEVEIKSRVSGILDKLYVKNGDSVYKNQVIAHIRIVPNIAELAASESDIKIAKINFENQNAIYNRNRTLFEKGVIAKVEFEATQTQYFNAKEQLNNARKRYQIVKSGNYASSHQSNTAIISTIDGIITLLPTKIGASIIQSNNFNEGTTIAKVANIEEMIFEGNVKEYEVAKLNQGMDVIINSAINDQEQNGILSEISTSGKNTDGMILFEIKSTLAKSNARKTGFSANAKIITEQRKNVLSIKEEWITIKGDSTYVLVHKNENENEKRMVQLGLSDGLYTEVLSGLKDNEMIRIYDQ